MMRLVFAAAALFAAVVPLSAYTVSSFQPPFKRLVIIKVDGLNGSLLYRTMQGHNPQTGKSPLPWFSHIFDRGGIVFDNFYVRGVSLSAPSWSLLDTGQHTVIRGNVEYDRYTGQVYDYLNVFPFYLGYARSRAVDMPGVEVLDRAGIPLLIDRFNYEQTLQSFQLFQRGVVWTTLKNALLGAFSGKALISVIESAAPISLSSSLANQIENILVRGLRSPQFIYLDLFTGNADHEGHATSKPEALLHVMEELDALLGRIATAIRQSPLADETLLAVVSDHGMNNEPGVISQTYNLPDLFNSPQGGAHHVVTDREQLSDYKLKGINPLVHRVVTPSTSSFYLNGEASRYPTAWFDIDGNERCAVHLRNSDINKIHILLLELARTDLKPSLRSAAAVSLQDTIEKHRMRWAAESTELSQELDALAQAIAERKERITNLSKPDKDSRDRGEDKADRRMRLELQHWQREHSAYETYLEHLNRLLAFHPDTKKRFAESINDLIPEMSLGDNNTVGDLEHYIAGPAAGGLVVREDGRLDEEESFRHIDYFALLSQQRARNNPQPQLSPKPIDFIAMALPAQQYEAGIPEPQHAYWLYADADHQLVILQDTDGRLCLRPVRRLSQDAAGYIHWEQQPWRGGLPLALFEDDRLNVSDSDRSTWLSGWHTERDWLLATHKCRYSNAVIGIPEELSPVAANVPGKPGLNPTRLRYERRRRELVQADFHVFASDHWNFNARFPNAGGNHGSFLRISTHSVWMMAGAGLPVVRIEEPYDSLNFASTILSLVGRTPPMPDRVVTIPAAELSSQ
ncbi:MAG TPA: alkaline phosphatase family protein [Bryobacteraceae bacterium]